MAYRQRNSYKEQEEADRRKRLKRNFLILVFGFGIVLISMVAVFFSLRSAPTAYEGPPPPRASTASANLPEFPWPPRSSAYTKIPSQYLLKSQEQAFLRDVAAKLESAFRSGGYGQTGYYSVPGGFALVSRLEQFKPNGLPARDPYRWSEQFEIPPIFSLDYFSDLIRGKVGHYRVIVFAVSNDFFSQASGRRVDIEQARIIAIEGANLLPPEVGDLPYTERYTCTALIYEFEKAVPEMPAEFRENSSLLAEAHLQKILPYLQR